MFVFIYIWPFTTLFFPPLYINFNICYKAFLVFIIADFLNLFSRHSTLLLALPRYVFMHSIKVCAPFFFSSTFFRLSSSLSLIFTFLDVITSLMFSFFSCVFGDQEVILKAHSAQCRSIGGNFQFFCFAAICFRFTKKKP